jgi:hypothetical protein
MEPEGVHKIPALDPKQNHTNLVHILTLYFSKITD